MPAGVDHQALQKVAARLQDVVFDPGAWSPLLDEICDAAGADVGSLMHASRISTEVSVAAINQETEPFLKHYIDGGWHRADLRTRAIPKLLRTGIGVDQDFTTTDEIARHPYYQEFLAPFGLRWWAGIGFRSGDDIWCLAIQRRTEKGYFDPGEQAKLVTISASLAEAATISRAIGHASIAATTEALDLVAQPALVLGRDGRVLRENAAAQCVYDGWFHVVGGRLFAKDREAAALLADIAERCRRFGGLDLRGAPIVIRRGERRPLLVKAHALTGAAVEPFSGGRAILLLNDLGATPQPPRDRLVAVFGLTPSEAALAMIVGRGESLDQACGELAITRETARSRLKSIFAKTGVNRQGEFVALLARLGTVASPG